MQNLSMREFKNTCDTLSLKQFIFSSENQNWDKAEHTIKVKLTFTIMMMAFNPNTICFKNSTDYICLNRVKNIKVREEETAIGKVFTIICGDSDSNNNDIAYTIVAR